MAGLTAIKRKGFKGGGSDASTTSFSKSYDSYNPGSNTASRANKTVDARQARGQEAADATNNRIAVRQAAKKQIEKAKLEKSNYGAPKKNIFEKIGAYSNKYNRNYKKKQLARYQKSKVDELNAKLAGLENFDGYYGDTDQTYGDFINDYAPSITEFGTPTKNNNFTGTGKYSKEFIDDVLSGKRAPPESFAKIDSKYPSMAVAAANFLGPKLGGPTTKEELMDIYSGNKTGNSYIGARDFDIEQSTGKKMMEIFEPNRYAREHGPQDNDNQPFIPINYNTGAAEGSDYDGTNQFTYDSDAFGRGGESADVTRASYIFNKGGRVPAMEGGIMGTRARRAMGGIMSRVDQRQGYFLGKIVKGIKGAVSGVAKAAGKVLKSDVGKMALLYAGGAYLGGSTMMGGAGGSFMSRMANPGNLMNLIKNTEGTGILGRFKGLKDSYDGMGKFGQLATMGGIGLGLSMIPGLNKPKPNEDSYADRGGSLIDPITGLPAKPAEMRASLNEALANANGDPDRIKQINDAYAFLPPDERLGTYSPYRTYGVKDGGRIGKAEGGLMDLGGMEKDYRAEGGFVPIGEYEKKDDVPARLSVNEFVFTADAVRGAGQGDIDKGAEIMENMMENLENGGTVSEESQGNKGAQQMFETSQRLGEVV